MAAITTREEFADYCLRKLGFPVMEVNVDLDQIEDRIDDAFQFYYDYHFDAVEQLFYAHQIVADDVTNGFVTVPDSLIFVKRVLGFSSGVGGGMSNLYPLGDPSLSWDTTMNNPFSSMTGVGASNVGYTIADQAGGQSGFDMLSFYLKFQNFQNLQSLLGTDDIPIRFNRHTNKVYFDTDVSSKFVIGNYVVLEGWSTVDPETYTEVYNDRWLKRYATALIKQQYGTNLSKFSGIALPGGVTLDGDKIYQAAQAEIDKLEEEMQSRYELPVDFICG
jgi:hypothetical protein